MAAERSDQAKSKPLEDVVAILPDEAEDRGVRNRLRKLSRELDQLIAVDADGEIVVDRTALSRVLQDADLFPPEVRDRIRTETEKHLGKKVGDKGRARQLLWRDLPKHQDAVQPIPTAELTDLGIDHTTTLGEAREILRERFPGIPEFWLDADADAIKSTTLRALAHNRSVCDCVVAKVGYWATLAIFAAAGAFLIVGTATGPWGIPLAIWLIGVLGGGTATIVLNCVMNPNWV